MHSKPKGIGNTKKHWVKRDKHRVKTYMVIKEEIDWNQTREAKWQCGILSAGVWMYGVWMSRLFKGKCLIATNLVTGSPSVHHRNERNAYILGNESLWLVLRMLEKIIGNWNRICIFLLRICYTCLWSNISTSIYASLGQKQKTKTYKP